MTINQYIEKRYSRWLDYSAYHCSLAGIPDEANDVLNEVIVYLLQKDESKLKKLLHTKKGQYTDLDFFVLRMIKLNCHSCTSPYRSRYKSIPVDTNVNLVRLNIEDYPDEGDDIPGRILEQFETVREVFESLNLSPKARRIFEFKFFQDQPFSQWTGPETKKQLYETYGHVLDLIKAKIFKRTLI